MKLDVTSPATLLELAQLCGARSRLQWAVARDMWAEGQTFVVRAGDIPLLLGGFYPLGGGAAEAWFNVTPAAAPHMLALIRVVRLTMRASGYREIVTIATSVAGERIARAAGFTLFGEADLGKVYQCHSFSPAARPRASSKRGSSAKASPILPASKASSIRPPRPPSPAAPAAAASCSPSSPARRDRTRSVENAAGGEVSRV